VGTILAIKYEKEKKFYGQSKSNKFLDTLALNMSPAQLKQSILINLEQRWPKGNKKIFIKQKLTTPWKGGRGEQSLADGNHVSDCRTQQLCLQLGGERGLPGLLCTFLFSVASAACRPAGHEILTWLDEVIVDLVAFEATWCHIYHFSQQTV
jgi:hypothetical protein